MARNLMAVYKNYICGKYFETFAGGTNGCWGDNPYVDVMLFYLGQYDSDGDGSITVNDYEDIGVRSSFLTDL